MKLTADLKNVFNENWLSQLIEKSNHLNDFVLLKGSLTRIEKLDELLKNALSQVAGSNEKAIMRVFVRGGNNPKVLEDIRNTEYYTDLDLDNWIQNTIGEDKYTVTFNGITKWNNEFHELVTNEVINPIVDNIGVPLSGIDTYAFMANHGYTPFGVHDDLDHSLIFHIGPKPKHVWIWPRDKYLTLAGNDNRLFDFNHLEKHAVKYTLEPGDCLFIPKGDFHVFKNDGFSAFLGLIIYPSTRKKMIADAVKKIESVDEELDTFISTSNFQQYSEKIIEEYLAGNAIEQITMGHYKSHYLLKSNGYSVHTPLKLNIEQSDIKSESLFKKPFCFPLLYIEDNDKLYLFIRGRMLGIKNITSLKDLIEEVNNREFFQYREIVSLFNKYGLEKISRDLILLFIRYGLFFPVKGEPNEHH